MVFAFDFDVQGMLKSGRNSRSYGLQLFFDLLKNSQFLIIFIKTLEEQKNFTIRDKYAFTQVFSD